MIYDNLIIHPKIWEKLTDYFTKDKLPHAFLLYGNNGIGKEAHAIEFASLINCTKKTQLDSCGKCSSCKKMKILQHGNLKLIHPMPRGKTGKTMDSPFKSLSKSELENYNNQLLLKSQNPYYKIKLPQSNAILINSIRSLKKELLLSSIEEGWNIILILEAEKLCYPNNVSANSLLKILEEPPEKTLFILITNSYSKIIDTIKSRCQEIFCPPMSPEKIYNIIDDSISDLDKLIIANISNGSINLAKNLENSIEEIYGNLKLFINACHNLNYKYDDKVIEKVRSLKRSNDSSEYPLFFRIIIIYFKDLFVYSKSKKLENIVYKNLDKHYDKITNYHINTDWNLCIVVIENTFNHIERNASLPLSINGMLIEIRNIINNTHSTPFDVHNWMGTR